MKLLKAIKHIYWQIYFWLVTKKSADGVDYVWKRRGYDKLIIVFSGMGKGKYNYMRALSRAPYDQLFIRDCWADNASYYWYEHKSDYPEIYTQNLIDYVIHKGNYNKLYTCGSSKGGTAAVYYGLKNNVDVIVAGACQYRVGDYLSRHQHKEHPHLWKLVVGEEIDEEWVKILDEKLEKMIEMRKDSQSFIKLIYSTEEHTYPEHVIHLIEKLDACGIHHEDQIESFPSHSMIGNTFKKAIIDYFK